jgi:hypothetical protein
MADNTPSHQVSNDAGHPMNTQLMIELGAARIGAAIHHVGVKIDFEVLALPGGSLIAVFLWVCASVASIRRAVTQVRGCRTALVDLKAGGCQVLVRFSGRCGFVDEPIPMPRSQWVRTGVGDRAGGFDQEKNPERASTDAWLSACVRFSYSSDQ